MQFKSSKVEHVVIFRGLNYTCCAVGIGIVWLATHSVLGIIGALIAPMHFQMPVPWYAMPDRDEKKLESGAETGENDSTANSRNERT